MSQIAFGQPLPIRFTTRQLGVNQARLSASNKSQECRDAKSRGDREVIGAKVTPAKRRVSTGDWIGLVPNKPTETDTEEEAAAILRNLGLQPDDDEEAEGAVAIIDSQPLNIGGKSEMTIKSFGQLVAEVNKLKRERVVPEVDAAIRAGQIGVDQRAWAIRCAAETPEHWAKFLAVTLSNEEKVQAKVCANLGLKTDEQLNKFLAARERRENGVFTVVRG